MLVDVYIPTYKRSEKIKQVAANIIGNTVSCRVVFIVEKDDMASYFEAIKAGAIAIINHRTSNYAGAINSAWECLHSEAFFAGADDLRFTPGWLKPLEEKLQEDFCVIGTNDLHNQEVRRGEHATHYLVLGDYIKHLGGVLESAEPVLFEGYSHNYTDREFIGTAKYRGVFSPCVESVVEHLHFSFGLSQLDDTYKKTRLRVDADEQLYQSRRHLWNSL